ncbi:MAG: DUF6880 family protein [Cyanobacteria bacterium P01_F01_bin.150]
MDTLSDILDQDLLRELAGDRYFLRGVDYNDRGLVCSLAQYGERITADVVGSETYQVSLWLEDNVFQYRCTCPLGVDEIFCKHCVAVGLAWIAEPPPYRPSSEAPASKGTTMADVRTYLSEQPHDALVQMILNQAKDDERLRQTLLMRVAAKQPDGFDIGTFQRSLYSTIIPDGFISYYNSSDYADKVDSATARLEELLDQGYGNEVIDLCETAMSLIDDAFESIDDSGGYVSMSLDRIKKLHYLACKEGDPDPHDLADSLLRLEMDSDYIFFDDAIETYGDVLGKDGLKTYGQLVDLELAELAEVDSESGDAGKTKPSYRFQKLLKIKEKWVSLSGSLEDLVKVIAEDLSQPSRYFQIVQLYEADGQMEQAIAWAEEGLNAFSDSYRSGNLGDFLIKSYEAQHRWEDALAIVWGDFDRQPSLSYYQPLKQQADKTGVWSEWRPKAIERVRRAIKPQPQATYFTQRPRNRFSGRDTTVGYSLLVEILLWEGNNAQAWEEANVGGCNPTLWFRLAESREQSHPEDALSIYKPRIEPLLDQTNNQAYQDAVDLLVKIRDLMVKGDRQAEFEAYLNEVCRAYKRKRNFIKFLKQKGLTT